MRQSLYTRTRQNRTVKGAPPPEAEPLSAGHSALLDELARLAARRHRCSRLVAPCLLVCKVYVVGFIAIMPLVSLLHITFEDDSFWHHLFACLFWGGFLWALLGESMQRQQQVKWIVAELSADTRAVGALAQICYSAQFLSMTEIAADALLPLLPRVKASDAASFSEEQMQALIGLLAVRNAYGIDLRQFDGLTFAVLKALEQVGDSRAVEPVRRLTTGANNRRYHKAAQECLGYIEQHGGRRDYHRTLLLPASGVGAQETLLRATGGPMQTSPELLLRAIGDEELG